MTTVIDRMNAEFNQLRQDSDRLPWDAALEAAASERFFPVVQRIPDSTRHQFRSKFSKESVTYVVGNSFVADAR